jgi:predicted membrane-bound mannosyltransferase
MNATTITEEDVKALRKAQSKAARLMGLIMIPLFVGLLVVCGVINLYFCSRFAHGAGMSMAEFIRSWFSDIDVSQTYAGMYVKALEVWGNAIIELTVAGLGAFMFVIARKVAKRNARILKFIEDKGI